LESPSVALDVVDILAINKLLADYNFAVDSGDGPTAGSYFTEDGVLDIGVTISEGGVDYGPAIRGRAAIAQFTASTPVRQPGIQHVPSNISIDGAGDQAAVRCYLHVYRRPQSTGPVELFMTARFIDSLRLVDGAWLFTSRKLLRDE
jgi:hypothetical protein